MDTLLATIVIGVVLIAIAGSGLFLFQDWRKQSLAKIAEERALIARRLQALSQREQEGRRRSLAESQGTNIVSNAGNGSP